MYTFSRNGIEIVTAFPLSVQNFRCMYGASDGGSFASKPCNQNPDRRIYPVFDLAEIRNYFGLSGTFSSDVSHFLIFSSDQSKTSYPSGDSGREATVIFCIQPSVHHVTVELLFWR